MARMDGFWTGASAVTVTIGEGVFSGGASCWTTTDFAGTPPWEAGCGPVYPFCVLPPV